MSKKEKGAIAIVLIIIILLAVVLPDSENDRTDEEIEYARSRYHSWSVYVKILGGVLAISFVGFLVHLHLDMKRIEKIEKERQSEKK